MVHTKMRKKNQNQPPSLDYLSINVVSYVPNNLLLYFAKDVPSEKLDTST